MAKKQLTKQAKEKAIDFIRKVRDKIALSIGAAFGLVIALSWNNAIQEGLNKLITYLGITGTTYIYKIITAIVVTIIAVLGIVIISRWAEKSV
ncbi:MAG: DUF5654 family protein [Candidatus Pacearchaeota archaeon]